MMYFDTHAHLTHERFDEDREALIAALPQNKIGRVLDVGCDLRDVNATLALCQEHECVYAAVGMHPHEAQHMTKELLRELEGHLKRPKVVALGEIGLDYHYDFSPRETQKKWFVEQLELAIALKVPVSLHVREAFGDCMEILRRYQGRFCGVMHCFSGSLETAFECVQMGLYIALGGTLTFQNARKLPDVATMVPLERLLCETDCPYLAPEPYRGKRNEPKFVACVADKIASLREEDPEHVAHMLYQNALACFGMDEA